MAALQAAAAAARLHHLSHAHLWKSGPLVFVDGRRRGGSGGSWVGSSLEITCAVGKQKKKVKERKKTGVPSGGKGWSFDQLMLVWDDAFDRCCEDSERVATLRGLGKTGFDRYGAGCVLVQESVRTLPRGPASGFSFHSRPSSPDSDDPPPYTVLNWNAQYVPRPFVIDPSQAPEGVLTKDHLRAVNSADKMEAEVPVVGRGNLVAILRGMDRTRIMGLTADPSSSVEDAGLTDAGGELPYNPREEELVLMLSVVVDGQPTVGADVVRAKLVGHNSGEFEGGSLWKLNVRDFENLPV